MNNKYTFSRAFYPVFAILATLAGAVAFTLLYIKNADLVDIDGVYQTVLFKSNGYTAAFIAFVCCAAVVLALSFLVYRKASLPTGREMPQGFSVVIGAACGLFILAAAVMQFVLKTENTPYRIDTLKYIMSALAIPAALYFLWQTFGGKTVKGLRMFFGIALAAWLCCTALCLHFFMNDFLTSPTRIVSMLSCCFLIFFVLADVRRDAPGLYVPLGLIAAFFAIPEGASKLVLSFMREAGFAPNISAFYALCRLALGVYALAAAIFYMFRATDAAPTEEGEQEAEEFDEQDEIPGDGGPEAEAEDTVQEQEDAVYADLAATVELPDTSESETSENEEDGEKQE